MRNVENVLPSTWKKIIKQCQKNARENKKKTLSIDFLQFSFIENRIERTKKKNRKYSESMVKILLYIAIGERYL